MKDIKPQGVVIPLVTPFTGEGEIDKRATVQLLEHVVSQGCHPFILGTTGESTSIPMKSKLDYMKIAWKANAGRKTFYAGISGMSLEESIQMGKTYADEGADILVAHLPGYYPLPVQNMLRYYIDLADALPLPLILYNIKTTTHMSIPIEIVKKLSEHENIIGLKDSERDVNRLDDIAAYFRDRNDFSYLLGWAAKSSLALKAGADGIVPGTGNAFPGLYYELYLAIQEGDYEKGEKYQSITNELSLVYQEGKLLSQALPGLKVMMENLGICESHCLPPCYPLDSRETAAIVEKMRQIMKRIPE
ncbi:putative 2-dehydro-3-deoxy-D-gluconate aldolase YagE [subsurface metagenome]